MEIVFLDVGNEIFTFF